LPNRTDLTGQKFGTLEVVAYAGMRDAKHSRWQVRCLKCGEVKLVNTTSLTSGSTESCGKKGCTVHGSTQRILPNSGGAKSIVFKSYRQQAAARSLEFALSKEHAIALCEQDCHYCGTPPSNLQKAKGGNWLYSGIDRKDNAQGYTADNVVSCCIICNRGKGALSYAEFQKHITMTALYVLSLNL